MIIIKIFTIHTVLAPTERAKREKMACGAISPNIAMSPVAIILAKTPEAMDPRKTANVEFTATLPISNVVRSKLPFSLTG